MEATINAEHIAHLKELLTDVLDLEEEFSDTDHFMEDLGLSSLMGLEVMVAMEKEYGVKFKEADIKNLTTVENVYKALVEKNANFN
ncbi:acyl carrier protein [Aliikangiella sp. IMCC44359]|uniref:acyl carrier protein n=1 Tax=Aliikangiella sp. IMCC44359 TaxID=3459125 RepID=UPI00403AADE9